MYGVLVLAVGLARCSWIETPGKELERVHRLVAAGAFEDALAGYTDLRARWPRSELAARAADELPALMMRVADVQADRQRWADAATLAYDATTMRAAELGDGSAAAASLGATVGSSRLKLVAFGGLMAMARDGGTVTVESVERLQARGDELDGFREAIGAWACEAIERLDGYGRCLAAADGPLTAAAAQEDCDDFLVLAESCPVDDPDVAVIARAVHGVEAVRGERVSHIGGDTDLRSRALDPLTWKLAPSRRRRAPRRAGSERH